MNAKRIKKPVLKTKSTVEFEVFEADIDFSSVAEYLDVKKLRKGKHKIEIGTIKGSCCGAKVYASVKDGYVIEILPEGCEKPKKGNKYNEEASKLFAKVIKNLDIKPPKPQPVEKFFADMKLGVSGTGGCFWTCWFGWCFICCASTKGTANCRIEQESLTALIDI